LKEFKQHLLHGRVFTKRVTKCLDSLGSPGATLLTWKGRTVTQQVPSCCSRAIHSQSQLFHPYCVTIC